MQPKPTADAQPRNVYQRVTEQVLAELAKGTAPWRKPWQADFGLPKNLVSRKAYRGVNVLTLMTGALGGGYPSNWWLTYKQATDLDGHVNKGEHGLTVMFYKRVVEGEPAEDAEEAANDRWRSVLKTFTVFNVGQCFGLSIPETPRRQWDPVQTAEQIAEAANIPITYEGARAFYRPTADSITLPPRPAFATPEGFYGTLLHELVHATGHASRLARPYGVFGDAVYAWEELIAELGSAMLSVIVGVPAPDFPNMANYLAFWRTRMQGDAHAIAEAAAAAQKAVEWLLTIAGLPLPE